MGGPCRRFLSMSSARHCFRTGTLPGQAASWRWPACGPCCCAFDAAASHHAADWDVHPGARRGAAADLPAILSPCCWGAAAVGSALGLHCCHPPVPYRFVVWGTPHPATAHVPGRRVTPALGCRLVQFCLERFGQLSDPAERMWGLCADKVQACSMHAGQPTK